MTIQTHQLFNQLVLLVFALSGSKQLTDDEHSGEVSFLLEPGGPDYVGFNSYDSPVS